MALSEQDQARLRDLREKVMFYGTPEKGYTDSGFWRYLSHVKTNDAHDHDKPVKHLMGDTPEYLIVVFLYMLACELLACPKSRQMRFSWATTAFATWHTMSGPYRRTIFQTKDAESADDMVSKGAKEPCAGRMDFILQHLPGWLQDPFITVGKGNLVGRLAFTPQPPHAQEGTDIPWYGSVIHAIPQGGDKVRQYTFSLMVGDECAFQPEFGPAMVAARPAMAGGGRGIYVSSVYSGSAFNQMVLETETGEDPVHEVPEAVQRGLDILGIEWPKGMKSWKTPSDVWVLETHYTADPAKDPERDGAEWLVDAAKGYVGGMESSGWQTEMEINYGAGGGDPVFPFAADKTCPIYTKVIPYVDVIERMRLYAGYDFGMDNPSAFEVWAIDGEGHSWSVWELYEPCLDMIGHTNRMKACPYWKDIEYIVGPWEMMSAKLPGAHGLKTLNEQFSKYGIHMRQGRKGVNGTMALRFLSEYWSDPKNPKAHITDATPYLASEVSELRWARHTSSVVDAKKNRPDKIREKNDHAWNATAILFDTVPGIWVPSRTRTGPDTPDYYIQKTMARNRAESRKNGVIYVR